LNLSAIVKPCLEKSFQQGNIYCLYDEQFIDTFVPEMLCDKYWQQRNLITGSAQGRGTTWFIETTNKDKWVLRHYYRGGLIGKLNKDKYWFNGYSSTRAVREFSLLKVMKTLDLPAPSPIACRIVKSGLFYQADLLSSRINHSKDLVARLSEAKLDNDTWLRIGKMIKKFHDNGIYHHDLNSHNILLDNTNKAWLIDFDRCEQRKVEKTWQQANLNRLLRSFRKEKAKLPNFFWEEESWQLLIEGYLSS